MNRRSFLAFFAALLPTAWLGTKALTARFQRSRTYRYLSDRDAEDWGYQAGFRKLAEHELRALGVEQSPLNYAWFTVRREDWKQAEG